jgi:hypothetical protein
VEVPRFRAASRGALPDDTDPLALLAAWRRAVGSHLAGIASLRGVREGRLTVAVPDARWEQEIGEHLGEILARLRGAEGLPGLEGIDLTLDPATVPSMEWLPRLSFEAGTAEPPPELVDSARGIPDRELARRWSAAVARILARRENAKPSEGPSPPGNGS